MELNKTHWQETLIGVVRGLRDRTNIWLDRRKREEHVIKRDFIHRRFQMKWELLFMEEISIEKELMMKKYDLWYSMGDERGSVEKKAATWEIIHEREKKLKQEKKHGNRRRRR